MKARVGGSRPTTFDLKFFTYRTPEFINIRSDLAPRAAQRAVHPDSSGLIKIVRDTLLRLTCIGKDPPHRCLRGHRVKYYFCHSSLFTNRRRQHWCTQLTFRRGFDGSRFILNVIGFNTLLSVLFLQQILLLGDSFNLKQNGIEGLLLVITVQDQKRQIIFKMVYPVV